MSTTVVGSIAAAVTTVATVVTATLPEAQAVLSPVLEGGAEHTATVVAMVTAFPAIAVLALVAGASGD